MRRIRIANLIGSQVANGVGIAVTISIASLIWAFASAEKAEGIDRRRFRTLPLMILVAASCSGLFLLFYGFAFNATEFLTSPAPSVGSDPSLNSASALRVAPISVAAGLFGGVLFVAFTVLKYRSHVQADARLTLEQQGAAIRTSEHFSERFAQAAEMLGSERAATRLGGAYALAALADQWQENRQQCVDFLCGYLRTPVQTTISSDSEPTINTRANSPSPPATPEDLLPRPDHSPVVRPSIVESYQRDRRETAARYFGHAGSDEVAVRKAIFSSIARGTRRPVTELTSWSNMTFDLSRTFVHDLDFSGCTFLQIIDFNGSIFYGSTNMRDSYFAQNAQFDGCLFTGNTWFSGSTFASHAWFRAAEFSKTNAFGRVVFRGGMLFNFAHFEKLPHLRDNKLGRPAVDGLPDIPFANLDGVTYGGDLTGCPDAPTPTVWANFTYVQRGYTIICERSHTDRHLGLEDAGRTSQ